MNSRVPMKLLLLISAGLALSFGCATTASAQLKAGQAKNLIRRIAGSDLPSSAVQIKQVSDRDDGSAEATAQIETACRFQKNESGQWEVREVRVGPDVWEDVTALAMGIVSHAGSGEVAGNSANAPHKASECETDPDAPLIPKRARCILAHHLAIDLPSDGVRVREISPLNLPLTTQPSATVLATVQLGFRFQRENKGGWRVTGLRSGNRDWISLDQLISAMNSAKRAQAKKEMEAIAGALQNFRSERGSYVASDQQRVLIDLLTPGFMSQVVRLDPWHRPYQYQGERDRFTLSSDGPDKTPNTPDDIIFKRP